MPFPALAAAAPMVAGAQGGGGASPGAMDYMALLSNMITGANDRQRQSEMAGASAKAYENRARQLRDFGQQHMQDITTAGQNSLGAMQALNRGLAGSMGDSSYLMDLKNQIKPMNTGV